MQRSSYQCNLALLASFCLTTLLTPATAGTIASSTFATGTDGWDSFSFVDNGEPEFTRAYGGASDVTYNPALGLASAYISAQDPDEGWQYFRAGSAFLGDELTALGGSFQFDIARVDTFDDQANSPEPPPVVLAGDNLVLVYTGAVAVPTSMFTTDIIPLLADGSWKLSALDGTIGAAATQAQFAAVLSDLTGIYILGDWYFGAGPINGDTYGIANVSLIAGPTPEPSPSILSGAALLGIAYFWRRRRTC